jgi:predicted nucleic acid-binding protein
MTVVIDCNVFVVCLTSRSPYHHIYRSLIARKFTLAVSQEILLEYEEIIQQKYGSSTAHAFISLLKELPKVFHVEPFTSGCSWTLIPTIISIAIAPSSGKPHSS